MQMLLVLNNVMYVTLLLAGIYYANAERMLNKVSCRNVNYTSGISRISQGDGAWGQGGGAGGGGLGGKPLVSHPCYHVAVQRINTGKN